MRKFLVTTWLILCLVAGYTAASYAPRNHVDAILFDQRIPEKLLLVGDEKMVVWYNKDGSGNWWWYSLRASSDMVSDANYIWPATVGDANTALAIDANSSGEITLSWKGFSDANGLLPDKTPGSIMFAHSTGYPLWEDNANLFFDDTNDYAGIGLNTPRDTLEVYQRFVTDPTLLNTLIGDTAGSEISAGTNNTHVGYNAGLYGDGSDNVTLGYLAGEGTTANDYSYSVILGSQAAIDLTTGSNNVIGGYQAAYNLITGHDNVIIGYQAGLGLGEGVTDRTSSYNVFIGSQAGYSIDDSTTSASIGSVFIGYQAGYDNKPGGSTDSDIFIGYQAGKGVAGSNGYNNIGIGHQVLYILDGGFYNIALGHQTLDNLNDGTWNTALGHGSLGKLTTGNYNTGISDTLANVTTASNNTACGYEASNFIITGADNATFGYRAGYGQSSNSYSYNAIFGSQAGYNISTSSNNLLAGYYAGNALTTGGSHVFLGYYAGAYDTTDTDLFYLNNQDRVTSNREQYEDLFYGVMAATPGAQDLNINADVLIRNDSSVGAESLNEGDFTTHAKWDRTGDFDDTGGNATYTHATGAGTLTQTSANMATAGVADRWYRFTYTCSNAAGTNTTPTITTSFASAAVSLPKGTGSHTVYFKSAAAPGDFVISVTSTSNDTWVIDDFSLVQLTGGDLIVNGDLDVYGNISGSGGSFTTGISDTQVVYSNSGVLAGHADFTWDDTNRILDVNAIDVNDVATLKPDSAVFQPATDSASFLDIVDADGGTPMLRAISTTENIIINGTAADALNSPLTVYGRTNAGISRGFAVNCDALGDQRAIPFGVSWLHSDTTPESSGSVGFYLANNDTTAGNYSAWGTVMDAGADFSTLFVAENVTHTFASSKSNFHIYVKDQAGRSGLFKSATFQWDGDILLNPTAPSGVTPALSIYGYTAGDALRSLDISCGSAAANQASFSGMSSYRFETSGNHPVLSLSTATDYVADLINGGAGADTGVCFYNNGTPKWTVGNDADTDALSIRTGLGAFGTNDRLIVTSTGGSWSFISATDTDTTFNFTGTTNSGAYSWLEDEDEFDIADDVVVQRRITTPNDDDTLGVGVTSFAVTSNIMTITGDGAGNTISTITGAQDGTVLYLLFVDGNVTITDTDAHTANTVDCAGAATDFTSADDTTLTLLFNGTSWYETSRSVN